MSNFAPTRTSYDNGDQRWLRDPHKAQTHGVTVAPANVTRDATGLVKSGSLVTGVTSPGLVLNDVVIKTGEKHLIAVVERGTVDRRFLPAPLSAANETALKGITFINGTVPA